MVGSAVGAAALWACSSLVVNRGLRGLRGSGASAVAGVVTGMVLALGVGASVLWVVGGFPALVVPDVRVVAAGVLTFPVGTGLYYLGALSFGGRSEVAAQFANVKPVLVLLGAAVVFGGAPGRGRVGRCGPGRRGCGRAGR